MSKRQSNRKRKKIHYYSPKRRAVYAKGDDIDHFTLFQLHGWMCYVCKQDINPKLRMPNIMAATVEHIKPLSEGGTHTWDNCAVSHAYCNFNREKIETEKSLGIAV